MYDKHSIKSTQAQALIAQHQPRTGSNAHADYSAFPLGAVILYLLIKEGLQSV
jgi:hypothetical protein